MQIGIDYVGITTPFYCNDGNGNFLLHQRSTETRDEHLAWDPGSGMLEHGISLEQNVLKEVMEEYGCKGVIQEAVPAHAIFRQLQTEKGLVISHWIAHPFFVKVDPSEARIMEPRKMLQLGWFRLNELPEPLHSGFKFTMSQYYDFFQKYR